MRPLFLRMASLPERLMRAKIAAEMIEELPIEAAARLIDEVWSLPPGEATRCIVDAFGLIELGEARRFALNTAAASLELPAVLSWLRPDPPSALRASGR